MTGSSLKRSLDANYIVQNRYKNVCFILQNAKAEEIEKKCTNKSDGKPFLDDNTIKVPFISNHLVSQIEIIFNDDYGQIAELIIN